MGEVPAFIQPPPPQAVSKEDRLAQLERTRKRRLREGKQMLLGGILSLCLGVAGVLYALLVMRPAERADRRARERYDMVGIDGRDEPDEPTDLIHTSGFMLTVGGVLAGSGIFSMVMGIQRKRDAEQARPG